MAGLTYLLAAAVVLSGANAAAAQGFTLTSGSIADGGEFDKAFTCRGADKSIALAWANAPAGTQAFAIIMDDPDARNVAGYTWVHWNVFNIPAATTEVAEGAAVAGGTVGENHFKKKRYNGPCPPRGTHTYFTAVYALDAPLDPMPAKPQTRDAFEKAFAARILAKAEIKAKSR
jgi:Raf kinase inhibitor-like YbhB/YbcL family protein